MIPINPTKSKKPSFPTTTRYRFAPILFNQTKQVEMSRNFRAILKSNSILTTFVKKMARG
jgi:hypothetical protein